MCSCPKLAQTEYNKRHDVVGWVIHWELYKESGVECSEKWYDHSPKSIEENEEVILKHKSGASGSRCIGFSVKEAGRPLGATRN